MSTTNGLSVGFIGAGMMASAIMDGIVAKNVVEGPESIICSDLWEVALEKAAEKKYRTTKSNQEVCKGAKDVLVIAVKPHVVEAICKDIMDESSSTAVIISVAAGITLESLEKFLPGRRVVRIMPNTPCLVGEAASGFSLGTLANDNDRKIVNSIFGSVGVAVEVNEILLNGVTGVSGSGPAYVFQFIEALADGGVRVGLPRATAQQLAAQVVKGAAEMVLQTGEQPGVLKDRVCSPGGTTIAAVAKLEEGGMRSAVIEAVKAATRRSLQLGGVPEEEIKSKHNL